MSGSSSTISSSEPRLGALRVQQSTYGLALPVVYGRTRISGNLIWYGDFVAIATTTTTTSGGKGGGGVTQENTTYTYEAAVMMALCEGPIVGMVSIWQGKNRIETAGGKTALQQLGLSLAAGQVAQSPWSHLSTKHAGNHKHGSTDSVDEVLGYTSTAYVYGSAYSLTTNAEIPNHSFEIDGKLQFGSGIVDASPKDIIVDLLTNPQYGANFPASHLADLSNYAAYVQAMGLFISPAFTDQQEAQAHFKEMADMTNSAFIWSEGKLKIIPRGDEAITGNGSTFTPDLIPIYDLTDDDYIVSSTEDPVRCDRKTPADAYNQIQIEYSNRANAYNLEIAEAKDQANIEKYGLRPGEPVKMHSICDATVARQVAQLLLQRALYVRNEYEFKLGWQYCLLEPMDLVTLTDVGLGLDQTPVRLISIEEDDTGLLTVRAEDYPFGSASATKYPSQAGSGYTTNFNAAPGPVSLPVFFEAPTALATTTGLEVWCAVSGASANWGGAYLWASLDGLSYKQVGVSRGGARYGVLTSALGAGSSGPANVLLSGQGGQLLSGTAQDAALLNTLCWVGDATQGEFMSYQTATLAGANAYSLSGLVRGAYGSPSGLKPSQSHFVRVDQAIAKSEPLDVSLIGQRIYFKLTSFNVYGGATESLADVQAYTYDITGNMLKLPPANVTGLSVRIEGSGLRVTWDASTEGDYATTIIKVGTTWESAQEKVRKKANSHLLPWAAAGMLKVWAVHLDIFDNPSSTPASVGINIDAPSIPTAMAVAFGTANIEASWVAPTLTATQQPLDKVELSWSPAFTSVVDAKKSNTANFGWLPAGSYTLYARYLDAFGNPGSVAQVSFVVSPPAQPVMTSVDTQVNAVTLRWQDAKTNQPIRKYGIYYAEAGTPFANAAFYGSAGADSRSDILFYRSSGSKVAFLVAEDVAGNVSTPRQIDLTITMPNDFVLATEYYEDWQTSELTNGTIVDGAAGQIMLPSFSGRTWSQRLSNNGWTTAQQKITAGFPVVIQPVPTSGKHVEQHNVGKVLPIAVIRVTPTIKTSYPGFVPTIRIRGSVGNSTTNWQPWLTGDSASISNFQYIEVEYGVTSDGKGFVVLDDLYVKVEITEVTESTTLALLATDVAGTLYTTTKGFLNVKTVQVTPLNSSSIARCNPIVDNAVTPIRVYVQAWDTSNNRVGGTVSLLITGV